jgi:hypothetical protein
MRYALATFAKTTSLMRPVRMSTPGGPCQSNERHMPRETNLYKARPSVVSQNKSQFFNFASATCSNKPGELIERHNKDKNWARQTKTTRSHQQADKRSGRSQVRFTMKMRIDQAKSVAGTMTLAGLAIVVILFICNINMAPKQLGAEARYLPTRSDQSEIETLKSIIRNVSAYRTLHARQKRLNSIAMNHRPVLTRLRPPSKHRIDNFPMNSHT